MPKEWKLDGNFRCFAVFTAHQCCVNKNFKLVKQERSNTNLFYHFKIFIYRLLLRHTDEQEKLRNSDVFLPFSFFDDIGMKFNLFNSNKTYFYLKKDDKDLDNCEIFVEDFRSLQEICIKNI